MLSNFCEEQNMADKIFEFHEKELQKWGLPKWANIKCPFCSKELPLRSIRSISLKLNTRNMGDVAVEVFCPYCSKMDTVYFRKEVDCIQEFAHILSQNPECLKTEPIIEEKMYQMQYNNLTDKMIGERNVNNQKGN